MFHQGARTTGGDLPQEFVIKVNTILDEFISLVAMEVRQRRYRNAIARSMLPCNLVIVLDDSFVTIAAQKSNGMPSSIYIQRVGNVFSRDQIFEAAIWDFGFDYPFIVQFPSGIIDLPSEERKPIINSVVLSHLDSEINRFIKEKNMVQLNPIFGSPAYSIQNKSIFVLMPYNDELDGIYNNIIKPTIEGEKLGFTCKRADEIKSNKAIIEDIFKGICEARIVIADLTNLNPNVMYELGIAHTVGKDTILLFQKNDEVKFPLDITHIKRIEYKNDAIGGKKLENDIIATIKVII